MTEEFNIEISEALADGDKKRVAKLLQEIQQQDVNRPIRIYHSHRIPEPAPRRIYHSHRIPEPTPRRKNQDSQRRWLDRVAYPLHLAMELDLYEVSESLIQHGADVNKIKTSGSNRGETPLSTATKDKNARMVTLLLANGANPNIVPTESEYNKGRTPLWLALNRVDSVIATLLLQNNADPNITPIEDDKAGTTPLWLATNNGFVDVVKLIIAKKVDVNAAPSIGIHKSQTPLFIAARNQNFEIIKLLVLNHADPNIADNKGMTPIMMATARGDFKIVKFLILNGAKVDNINNKNWQTALKLAEELGAADCVSYIKDEYPHIMLMQTMMQAKVKPGKNSTLKVLPTELLRKTDEMLKPKKPIQ